MFATVTIAAYSLFAWTARLYRATTALGGPSEIVTLSTARAVARARRRVCTGSGTTLHGSESRDFTPGREARLQQLVVLKRGEQVPAGAEVVTDRAERSEKLLGVLG